MPDFEQAHQAAESLEALKLEFDVARLINGLEVQKPNAKIGLMRTSLLKGKLVRALQLVDQLEAVLK